MTLYNRLRALAAQRPDAPAWLGESPVDRAGLVAGIAEAARRYAPACGRVVAFAAPDGPELAVALLGAIHAGAIAYPIAPGATAHERASLLAGLDLAGLVEDPRRGLDLAAASAAHGDSPGVALLVATSGSSGRPKRVALHQAGIAWNGLAHAASLGLDAGPRTLSLSPLYHAFPLVAVVLGSLLAGGSVDFLAAPFTPRAFARRCEAQAIGYAALPLALLRLLVVRYPNGVALPATISVGATPVAADELVTLAAWAQRAGSRLYHTYGLSEAGPRVATLAPEALPAKAASVGRLLPGVSLRVIADGQEAPPGAPGEIWLQSPSLMLGYWPDGPGSGLAPDGWLPTGDRGWLDAEGYLHLSGRLKDVIITGGTTVSAREIEEALLAHASVAEAAVIGVPDAAYGEAPRAFVVASAPVTAEMLLAHLAERLSRAKWPRAIALVSALPRTSLGKIDKQRLKEVACEASP